MGYNINTTKLINSISNPKRKKDVSQLILEDSNPKIAKIQINEKLEIVKLNTPIKRLVNVRSEDIGRPIFHFTTNFYYNDFIKDIRFCLEKEEKRNVDITDYEGNLFNLRMVPYQEGNKRHLAIFFITTPQMTRVVEKLQANEKTTQALLNTLPDLVVRVSHKGKLLDYLTPSHVNIKEFGFRQHYIGHLIHNVLPSNIGLKFYNAIMKAGFSNQTQSLEYTINLSREKRYLKARIISANIDDLLIIVKDITKEAQQKKRIKEGERRIQSTFTNSPLGMAIISLQFKYLEVNDALCKMFGYTKEEFRNLSVPATSHSSDFLWCMKKVKEDLLTGKKDILVLEKRYIRKNGETFTVNISIGKYYDVENNCIRLVTTLEDISEKKKAQLALRQREQLYRNALKHVPEAGVVVFDEELRINLIGGGEFKKYNVIPHKVYGEKLYDVLPQGPFSKLILTECKDALNGATNSFEMTFKGSYYQISIAPIEAEENGIKQGIISFHNITNITKVNKAINSIAEQIVYKSDTTFFKDIVKNIADYLGVTHAFIGEYNANRNQISSVAYWKKDGFGSNFIYDIKDTPCEHIIKRSLCIFPEQVAELFPQDTDLVTLGVESYMGVPLFDKNDNSIGILVIMDQKPLEEIELAKSIAKVFASRIGAELERRKTYRALQESEHKFKAIFNNSYQMMSLVDVDGNILATNHPSLTFSEKQEQKLVGLKVWDAYADTKDGKAWMQYAVGKAAKGKFIRATAPVKNNITHKIHSLDSSFKPIKGDDGEISMIICEARDISELEEAKAKVVENEKLFRSLYENSPEGIVMTDVSGKIQKANNSFCKIFGYSETELQEKFIHEMSVAIDKDKEIKEGDRVMKGEIDSYTMEKQYYRKDGSILWGNVAISVLRNEDGKIQNVIGMVEDITKRKIAEKEIKRINTALESKVEERTKALKNSNEELSRFAYVTAHDLKQPLRTIGSFAKLLDKRFRADLKDEGQQYLQFINEGVSNMTDLINALLQYAIHTNEKSKVYTQVNANELLDKVIGNLGGIIKTSNATIHYTATSCQLNITEVKIQQVLQNLIANALKFRKEDEAPVINIDIEDKDTHWKFRVNDNGIGIKEKDLKDIFLLLKKLHNQEDYAGHGIGLATCKKIVEQHLGDIWVESKYGVGSTFYFTIPK